VTLVPVEHPPLVCYGLAIEDPWTGAKLSITGDTSYDIPEESRAVLADADLLLADGIVPASLCEHHPSAVATRTARAPSDVRHETHDSRGALAMAEQLNADRTRLVHLAHFYPAEEAFEEPLAIDGEEYVLREVERTRSNAVSRTDRVPTVAVAFRPGRPSTRSDGRARPRELFRVPRPRRNPNTPVRTPPRRRRPALSTRSTAASRRQRRRGDRPNRPESRTFATPFHRRVRRSAGAPELSPRGNDLDLGPAGMGLERFDPRLGDGQRRGFANYLDLEWASAVQLVTVNPPDADLLGETI